VQPARRPSHYWAKPPPHCTTRQFQPPLWIPPPPPPPLARGPPPRFRPLKLVEHLSDTTLSSSYTAIPRSSSLVRLTALALIFAIASRYPRFLLTVHPHSPPYRPRVGALTLLKCESYDSSVFLTVADPGLHLNIPPTSRPSPSLLLIPGPIRSSFWTRIVLTHSPFGLPPSLGPL